MLILCPLALIPCMSLGGKIMTINKQFVMPQYLLVYFTKNSTQYQKRQFVSIFVLIFMSLVLSRISTTHLRLDCVNYFSMWLAATQARLLNLRYSFKFLLFLWIFNSVSGKSNNATITKARCYANCLTKVSNLSIERLNTTFTSNGKREFVRALGQVSP